MSAPGIPPGYRDLLRRASGDGLPFEPTGDDRRLARDLADAGLIRVHAYSDGSGEEVQGITVKGREYLDAPRRERNGRLLHFGGLLFSALCGAVFGHWFSTPGQSRIVDAQSAPALADASTYRNTVGCPCLCLRVAQEKVHDADCERRGEEPGEVEEPFSNGVVEEAVSHGASLDEKPPDKLREEEPSREPGEGAEDECGEKVHDGRLVEEPVK